MFPRLSPAAARCILSLLALLTGACGTPVKAPVHTRGEPVAPEETPSTAPDTLQPVVGQHMVRKGETLYSVAWRYGHDYRDVALWNKIPDPYRIYPGQVISLIPPAGVARSAREIIAPKKPVWDIPAREEPAARAVKTPLRPDPSRFEWRWPTNGMLIQSDAPTSRKGINISGQRGQSINAAAPGFVVYSGSGLLGYGRLIIVKHSDTYLSAYAHNETLLVKEGDRVSLGQQIATMGLGNNGRPLLHFEIRKDGRPVNPLDHLPKNRS